MWMRSLKIIWLYILILVLWWCEMRKCLLWRWSEGNYIGIVLSYLLSLTSWCVGRRIVCFWTEADHRPLKPWKAEARIGGMEGRLWCVKPKLSGFCRRARPLRVEGCHQVSQVFSNRCAWNKASQIKILDKLYSPSLGKGTNCTPYLWSHGALTVLERKAAGWLRS